MSGLNMEAKYLNEHDKCLMSGPTFTNVGADIYQLHHVAQDKGRNQIVLVLHNKLILRLG